MTGASRDPGTSANFRYTTSTDMTALFAQATPRWHGSWGDFPQRANVFARPALRASTT
jgi:hypothetical protein